MVDGNAKAKLADAPIKELNLGDAKLRRAIIRAGFESLVDVLELPVKDVDNIFNINDADAIIAMQERYQKNPDIFAATVLKKKAIDTEAVDSVLIRHTSADARVAKYTGSSVQRTYYTGEGPRTLPPMPFSDTLREFEKRAREAFDDLGDRYDDVMVYQAFDEFSTELDDVSNAFESFFRYYA